MAFSVKLEEKHLKTWYVEATANSLKPRWNVGVRIPIYSFEKKTLLIWELWVWIYSTCKVYAEQATEWKQLERCYDLNDSMHLWPIHRLQQYNKKKEHLHANNELKYWNISTKILPSPRLPLFILLTVFMSYH